MSTPTPTPPVKPKREFDQVLSSDVKIKKLNNSNKEYKITFSKKNISKVLMYQVWSSTSAALNSNREVKEMEATKWVNAAFPKVENGSVPPDCNAIALYAPVICQNGKKYSNSSLAGCAGQTNCTPYVPFTPTCVMELRDDEGDEGKSKKHVFVINNAKFNKHGHVVFYVSSKYIDPNSTNKIIKKLKKIPTGEFHNVRFDIDSTPDFDNCSTLYNDIVQYFSNAFAPSISVNTVCNNDVNVCINNIQGSYPNIPYNDINTFCTGAKTIDDASTAYSWYNNFSQAYINAGYE